MGKVIWQLKAVLWKAFCLRKVHYWWTLISFLFPILFAYLMISLKVSYKSEMEGQKIFAPVSKSTIIEQFLSDNTPTDILYTPNSTEVNNLMNLVKAKFNNKIQIMPAPSENEMENWFYENEKNSTSIWRTNYGIIFNLLGKSGLNYTVRNTKFDIWNTKLRFPLFQIPGPMEAGHYYFDKGFIAIQLAIDETFIQRFSASTPKEWFMQEFPYPEYRRSDSFAVLYDQLLPVMLIYGYLFSFISILKGIGEEKESGIRERLRMSGVKTTVLYLGWIIDHGIVAFIVSLIISVIFTVSWIYEAGAIFEKSNVIIIWTNYFLYYMASIVFAIVTALFFKRTKYAMSIGFIVWLGSFFLLKLALAKLPSGAAVFFICLVPNGFLVYTSSIISRLEGLGVGATFSKLYIVSSNEGIALPLGCAWIAALLWIVIGFYLALYLDAVLPGPYGIPQRWDFIFGKRFRRAIGRIFPARNRSPIENGESTRHLSVEDGLKDTKIVKESFDEMPVGIKINNIYKKYGKFCALNDLSIDIYKGEITALLGHNGAGKTTLLSIITGMIPPSEGSVQTEEYDVFSNLDKFRSELGYCPQDNLLLPNLTVAQHLIFFSIILGHSRRRAIELSESIALKCRLNGKEDSKVAQLSGGMRRKLCLAICLVSDPKILILDEPTSGLDPESRRAFWDILFELRSGRTVLLTTHFMEEADVLGDRIAILSHGELKCYGTSLFLKKHYGSGYYVTILLSPETTEEMVKELISIIDSGNIEATLVSSSLESISIQLPLDMIGRFPEFFRKLEQRQDLGVVNLTVSCTTIDDVFQKVNEEEGVKFNIDEVDMPFSNQTHSGYNTSSREITVLYWQRLRAIGIKKFQWLYRNWLLGILYLLMPLLLIMIVTIKITSPIPESEMAPLLLNMRLYEGSDVVLAEKTSRFFLPFKEMVENQKSNILEGSNNNPIVDDLLEYGRKDEAKYRVSMIVAGNMSNESPTVLYSSIAYHAPPVAANLISNAIVKGVSNDSSIYINTYNHPYTFNSESCSGGISEEGENLAFTALFAFSLSLLISFFVIFVHIERISQFKELQLLTGLRFPIYWAFTFLIDFLIYAVLCLIIIIVMLVFDFSEMFRNWNFIGSMFSILLLYGISNIWCAYLWSYFFRTYNSSSSCFMMFTAGLTLVGALVVFLADKSWKYFFFLNPLQPFTHIAYDVVSAAKFDLMCRICKGPSIDLICAAKKEANSNDENSTEMIYLGLDWIIYMALIFMIDSGLVSLVWYRIKVLYLGPISASSRPTDADVSDEKEKIKAINEQNEENPELVVDGLAKKYTRQVTAVKDVSFVVLQGQCFGLLGTNGAGKSTTFEMLSGYLRPSNGDAFINGYSLQKNRIKYKHCIGYCPQSNTLLESLTGKETLSLFARLRGIPSSEVPSLVKKWVNLLALEEYANRPTYTYSGGNLRKLSTAIALIGNPRMVFLDEPTTGVDPVTRRKIWQVLKMVLENKQTIVITSHSMDECEALCDRLTIMVEGIMRCIGNIQYLKKKYGKGYTIVIKVRVISDEDLDDLKIKMIQYFSDKCHLRDEHKGLLHYHVEETIFKWSDLFEKMAELRAKFPAIEDFMLTDTSLEQVFLAFASENIV